MSGTGAGAGGLRRRQQRFSYAGVSFVVDGPETSWALDADHLDLAVREANGDATASVACSFQLSNGAVLPADPAVRWRWSGDEADVRTKGVKAVLTALSDGRHQASAVLSNGDSVSALVTALASAIVSRSGGLILHAATVQLGGRAILFVGPSGAGKSTSAEQCAGATWIAHDRAAVLRADDDWRAWGMVGGEPTGLPREPRRCLPLGAVLRVRQTVTASHIERLSGAEGVATVRECVQCGEEGATQESLRLESAVRLCEDVPVGVLHAKLGEPLAELVSGFAGGATQ